METVLRSLSKDNGGSNTVLMVNKHGKGIALFDLDQTLIAWDTQLLFCNWVLRREPSRRAYLLLFLPFLVLARVLGSEGLKRIFLSFLWRMPRQRLEELVAELRRAEDLESCIKNRLGKHANGRCWRG